MSCTSTCKERFDLVPDRAKRENVSGCAKIYMHVRTQVSNQLLNHGWENMHRHRIQAIKKKKNIYIYIYAALCQ